MRHHDAPDIAMTGDANKTPSLPRGAAELERRCAELEARARDLTVINRFASTLLTAQSDVEEILWELAREALGALGLTDCVIYLRQGEWLYQRAAFGPKNPSGRQIKDPIRIRIGAGIVGAAAETGQTVVVEDTENDVRYIVDDAERRSEMAVPIVVDGQVVGVVDSEHEEAGFYDEWRQALLGTLASMAGARLARARLEQERDALAKTDPLSGLLNRRGFLNELQAALDIGPMALIYLDLDNFGSINDSLGHSAGDVMLGEVGERIGFEAGQGAVCSRIGGDEFVVASRPAGVMELAHRLQVSIARPFAREAVKGLQIRASVGVAIAHGKDAASALRDADLAMYEVKRTHRGEIAVFDEDVAERLRDRIRLTAALSEAIELDDGRIDTYFQPIHRVDDGRLVGAELLARWNDPVLGRVPPDQFVLLAEQSGLIRRLGDLLERRALARIVGIHRLRPEFCFHINKSGIELATDGFARRFCENLRASGIAPHAIAIEMTETSILSDEGATLRNLDELVEAGVSVVLDDFGTGYASLSCLAGFPFRGLKIDRSFVSRLTEPQRDVVMVRAMVQMARGLGLEVTAEGVESEAQLAVLRSLACHHAQGWLFGAAMPSTDFEELAAQ
ncbi:MAG: putative bifunctional diguanylate cyclase/phosphodiesterase [Planctomycetota bacterium]